MNPIQILKTVGLIAGAILPLWNIPLIVRIWKRKSSDDFSLAWVLGVETCILAMLPSAILTSDPAFKVLGIVNSIFFSAVTVVVLIYHSR